MLENLLDSRRLSEELIVENFSKVVDVDVLAHFQVGRTSVISQGRDQSDKKDTERYHRHHYLENGHGTIKCPSTNARFLMDNFGFYHLLFFFWICKLPIFKFLTHFRMNHRIIIVDCCAAIDPGICFVPRRVVAVDGMIVVIPIHHL